MTLAPDMTELIARARSDLRMGLPVVLRHGPEALVICVTETMAAERLSAMRALDENIALVITARRAETLKARAYDGDLARIRLPFDCDLHWVQATANPSDDLIAPMKGPYASQRGGDVTLHRLGLALVKSARLLPAFVAARADPDAMQNLGLTSIALEAAESLLAHSPLHQIVSAKLPMDVSEVGRLHLFRPEDGSQEHYAIEIGRPDRSQPVLARIHSECFTGDLMGSLKCDCGPQLRGAFTQMGEEGAGVLIYPHQ